MRTWEPSSRYIRGTNLLTKVRCWTWTRHHGLRVTYTDGLTCRSDWQTLTAFLRAIANGREDAHEVLAH